MNARRLNRFLFSISSFMGCQREFSAHWNSRAGAARLLAGAENQDAEGNAAMPIISSLLVLKIRSAWIAVAVIAMILALLVFARPRR